MVTDLPVPAGLCPSCRHVSVNQTRRGPTYLRCTRAAWDERLVKYPQLPVLSCVGFEPPDPEGRGIEPSSDQD